MNSRAEFEAWCKSRNQDTTRDDRPDPALAWGYMNMITHELWVGWDAAWNRRAQPERKLTDAIPILPQSLINLIGEYGMARTDGVSPIGVDHRWELLIAGIKDYARSVLAAQPASNPVIRDFRTTDEPSNSVGAISAHTADKSPVLTLSESGKPILETMQGCTMPADYSFECINNFVHCEDPAYEDLQCLALGMASHIEALNRQLPVTQPAAATVPDAALMQKVTSLLNEIASFNELNEFNYTNEDVAEINNWGVMVWDAAEEVRKALPAMQAQDGGGHEQGN